MSPVDTVIKVEPDVKTQAAILFAKLGMDLDTATNIFYRQAIVVHGFPFEIYNDEPNEETYQAIEDAENDRNMIGPFDSVDELFKELES